MLMLEDISFKNLAEESFQEIADRGRRLARYRIIAVSGSAFSSEETSFPASFAVLVYFGEADRNFGNAIAGGANIERFSSIS